MLVKLAQFRNGFLGGKPRSPAIDDFKTPLFQLI